VMLTMTEKQIRHMPVVVDGKVAAIISLPDVVKYRLWKIGQLADAAEQEPDDDKRVDILSGHLRKLPAAVRRNQIVEVARQVIVAQGMKGFTVRNITKEAGLSPGMVALHFGNTEGLLRAVFDSVMFELPDTTMREPTNLIMAIINLRMIVKRYFDPQYFSRASLLVWLPLLEAMLRDGDFRKTVYARDEEYVGEFALHVGRVMAFRQAEGDAMSVARNLMSFMDGLWLRWCHSERTDTRAEHAAAMEYLESKVGSLQIEGV
jgi:TetR/AcrR family transcriptional repressor of bet genes